MARYAPVKNENKMMTDALNFGKYLTENNHGQNEMLLDFVHEYGLLGIMSDIAGSDIRRNERVIDRDNIFTESDTANKNNGNSCFQPFPFLFQLTSLSRL